jgi:hypothetical protein
MSVRKDESAASSEDFSQAKFAVRTEADELQRFVVRLTIDQYEVGTNMAITKIRPLAGKSMVARSPREPRIRDQPANELQKAFVEFGAVSAAFFAFVIPLEL